MDALWKLEMLLNPSESQEQCALIQWARSIHLTPFDVIGDFLFSIPNGGSRHKFEAKNLKKQGLLSGVSDLFFAYPVPPKHGLFIEMKRRGKDYRHPSVVQNNFINRMYCVGFDCHVAKGWEDARDYILKYLDGEL